MTGVQTCALPISGEDGDDEDWEEDDAEETALEGYTTAVDDEDNLVDEYQIFKTILQSKTTARAGPASERLGETEPNVGGDGLVPALRRDLVCVVQRCATNRRQNWAPSGPC